MASGELFVGVQRLISSHYFAQWGIAGVTSRAAVSKGIIWEFADPTFDNFTYQYKIQHNHFAVKGKILSDVFSLTYLPYLSASVGVAVNHACQFSMTPRIYEVLPAPLFQSASHTSFTYSLGLGLVKTYKNHWQWGIGYEFADFGSSALGPSSVQTLNRGLSLNHLYTNQLQFQLSYLSS